MTKWPQYSKKEIDAVADVLESGRVNYWTGERCKNFEIDFAKFCKTKYAVALMNGTVALEVALKSIGIKKGDEVIVTSRTFIASVSSIVNVGATPIFVDVDLDSQNLDSNLIQNKITDNTKAIMCVHLAGWPCDMDKIKLISEQFGLLIVEDCSQAHGAKYKGNSVGSLGDIGCWSFCQDKIISTGGEGGMVTTNDETIWKKVWSYKDHGKSFTASKSNSNHQGFKWLHNSFGSNYRMTELQAVIGSIQLTHLDSWQRERYSNSQKIWDFSRKIKGLRVPQVPKYIDHACYKCYIFVDLTYLKKGWSRDRIIKEINASGVHCFSGSCSEVYLEFAFEATDFRPQTRLKNAKVLGETSLAFLVHPGLSDDYINHTCHSIKRVMLNAVG